MPGTPISNKLHHLSSMLCSTPVNVRPESFACAAAFVAPRTDVRDDVLESIRLFRLLLLGRIVPGAVLPLRHPLPHGRQQLVATNDILLIFSERFFVVWLVFLHV